jgi:hypothetical protein
MFRWACLVPVQEVLLVWWHETPTAFSYAAALRNHHGPGSAPQVSVAASAAARRAYRVLVVVDPGYNQHLALDYGQQEPTNVQDTAMEALAVAVSPMVSTAAALNYLYSKGWEPVQSAAFTYDQLSDRSVKSQLHYVLHCRIP